MRQVVLRAGQVQLEDLPAPMPETGRVLVANVASVISSGTERAAVAAGGGGSPPVRALRNPALIRKAYASARERGLRNTLDLVRGATAPSTPLGYCSAGVVLDTGGTPDVRVGQRVACAGAGYASHAEVVSVPANLLARVPDSVALRDAAFTTLGAIALQGVRRSVPTLGERVVVVGLGLLGLITMQLLRAAGARVAGVEPDEERRRLAAELGAEQILAPSDAAVAIDAWSERIGADAVVITASSPSNTIVNDAARLLRHKGRIVVVGDVGLDIERGPVYAREADILISTSYGPGRYDGSYEEGGIDYPISYVRWTENRNMDEFLRLLDGGHVRVDPLIGLELPIDRAQEAYAAIEGPEPPLAAVLLYDPEQATRPSPDGSPSEGATGAPPRGATVSPARGAAGPPSGETAVEPARNGSRDRRELRVALIGAGGFATGVHLPNLRADPHVRIAAVVTRSASTAGDAARLAPGAIPMTDWHTPLADPEVDLVVIGTRHDSHAEIAVAALGAGKAVLVEKPLGLTREEIDSVWRACSENTRLAIGFNRPFAPLATRLRTEAAKTVGPLHVIYRVNAPLTPEHWLNDPLTGGGRLLGEACHMFDFTNWLCGTPKRVVAVALPAPAALHTVESSSVTIDYASGSVATVHYSGVGAKTLPKERVEVLRGGRAWVLDDFRTLTSFDAKGEHVERQRRPDKGHAQLMSGVLAACRGEQPFAPDIDAAYAAQSVALAALESIASGTEIAVVLRGAIDAAPERLTAPSA
jgi:predicted dehydrogenase/threonine dehydrogenase-like Zn-dependent dehydrogenase